MNETDMPSARPTVGIDDLQTLFPQIAKEAYGWDPRSIKAGSSSKKMTWRCDLGHIYEATPKHRTTGGTGCPYCSNRKVLEGFNDFKTKYPELSLQADGWDPSTVVPGCNLKKRWKCIEGHIWESAPNTRISQGSGCPYCANNWVLAGFNDLLSNFPEIAQQANGWDPSSVIAKSSKKLLWKCNRGHVWGASTYSRTAKKTGCSICCNKKLETGFNDLRTLHSEVASSSLNCRVLQEPMA